MNVDLLAVVTQYRAGLEAEMVLLYQLESFSSQQHQASQTREFLAVPTLNDARDATMASLVAIEHELKPLRQRLLEARDRVQDLPEFQQVVAFHRQAAELVSKIDATDRRSLAALKDAEEARHDAAAAMEKGESTLAAYRRVVSPNLTSATLVDRRG